MQQRQLGAIEAPAGTAAPIAKVDETSKVQALVPINPNNSRTAAAVTGGAVGFTLAGGTLGTFLATSLFISTAYLAKKRNDDVSLALEYIGTNALRAVNFLSYLADKYDLAGAVGAAADDFGTRVEANFEKAVDDETKRTFDGVRAYIVDVVTRVDEEFGIVNSIGSAVEAATNVAGDFVDTLLTIETEYDVTGKVRELWAEVTDPRRSQSAR